jgi:GGDEF domain-containing protein
VRCEVSDTGPGIRAEDLPKVFGKFQQFGQVPKGREKGTGLGLSLCKGFIELHGGRIGVESEFGQGTRFFFQLPLVKAEDVFADQLRHLFEEAVSHHQPLTLIRMEVAQWTLPASAGEEAETDQVLHRLSAVVRSTLGTESVVVVHRRGGLLLALPEIAKEAARLLADKIGRDFQTSLDPATHRGIDIKMAAYPDDGTAAEQLLQSLESR